MNIASLYAEIKEANRESIKLADRLGFKKFGDKQYKGMSDIGYWRYSLHRKERQL